MDLGRAFDEDLRRMATAVVILAVVLFVAAFVLGRCTAGYVVKMAPVKEASNGTN